MTTSSSSQVSHPPTPGIFLEMGLLKPSKPRRISEGRSLAGECAKSSNYAILRQGSGGLSPIAGAYKLAYFEVPDPPKPSVFAGPNGALPARPWADER